MIGKSSLLRSIHSGLSDNHGTLAAPEWLRDLTGGDINNAALIGNDQHQWFLKYKQRAPEGMFAAEALALSEIAAHKCIRVPKPLAFGRDGDTGWLVLEFIELTSSGSSQVLGEHLAALHTVTAEHFGWVRDNFIGTTAQHNSATDTWSVFWRDKRLRPQLDLAYAKGYEARLANRAEQLLEEIDHFMEDHQPAASLLHGDLWAGNKAFADDGQPVIFDPASYYGDRETDIAMTELFGGFGPKFYAAYNQCAPLPHGYQLRRDLYNLYHMLNHLNLFGAGYLTRCESIVEHLLAQVR